MSYSKKTVYHLIPDGSYKVIRNCAKCGGQSTYVNTNNFRVNANGSQLDVWLIYQCEKCKHTYNLTIYERIKMSNISKEEYGRFLANDLILATEYGNRKELFTKNKAEIDLEQIGYHITVDNDQTLKSDGSSVENQAFTHGKIVSLTKFVGCGTMESIIIQNHYQLKIRTDKVLAEILHMSRSRINTMIDEGKISAVSKYVSQEMEIFCSEGSAK
jgi:hypothetical protein